MTAPSLPNATINNTDTSDVTKLTANDGALLNAISDGTSDLTFGTFTGSSSPNIKSNLLPTDETYSLGNSSYQWTGLYLNNGATDGGAIYFDGGSTTKFIKCSADGTILDTDIKLTVDHIGEHTGSHTVTLDSGITVPTCLIGANANFTDFAAATCVSSTGNTTATLGEKIGIVGEALAVSGSYNAYGVFGLAKTAGAQSGTGIFGRAYVGATGDTGEAIAGSFTAIATHAGANNVAIYAYAANGAANYSFYGTGGEILNVATYAKAVGGTNRAMLVDNTGLFGNATSSLRYKKNINDIPDTSWIYQLRPVMFDYIDESKGVECSGLIAEEVEEINKRLVTYNNAGQPETVEYHRLIPMLLKEIQNLNERIKALEAK